MSIRTLLWLGIAAAVAAATFLVVGRKSDVERLADQYRSIVLQAFQSGDTYFSALLPNEIVCFLGEGGYAPAYVKLDFGGSVAFDEGDDSSGYWFVIVTRRNDLRAWIFKIDKREYDWADHQLLCVDRVEVVSRENRKKVVAKFN